MNILARFKSFNIQKSKGVGIWPILIVGFLLRVALYRVGTLELDLNTFIGWSNRLVNLPLNEFYFAWSDYLPGYLYMLLFLGKLNSVGLPLELLYKLPAILSDVACGYLIFQIVKRATTSKLALISAALYVFNPAVFANSAMWGQVDSFTALFAILAIYFLKDKWVLSALFLSFGTLIKPHTALAAPLLVSLFFKYKWPLKKMGAYVLTAGIAFVAAFAPFASGNLWSFFIERLTLSANQYPYTSVNAFNFWAIFGMWSADSFIHSVIGIGAVACTFIYLMKFAKQSKLTKYLVLVGVFSAAFMFLPRMHERHLLPIFAPLAIAIASFPSLIVIYVGTSLVYLANLHFSFIWITQNFAFAFSPLIITFLILANLLLFLLLLHIARRNGKTGALVSRFSNIFLAKSNPVTNKFGKDMSKKKVKTLLVVLIAFALFARVFALGEPKEEYFDEVYHAFTARLVLHGDPKAWEWWNTHPEGFAYEWTHPPVAKLAMASGMFILGENSFSWRMPGALLGVATIFLLYLLTLSLFGDRTLAFMASAIFSLEGLFLVMNRVGMNDTYMLFFVLLSLYLFLQNKNFWSALAWGLAISSKWSAIWSVPIFALIYLRKRKKFKFTYLWFLVLPPIVYLASYFQLFLTGHGLDIFWGVQKQMWWYHTNLTATHPYSSLWWQWPLMIRPIYLYTSSEIGGFVSRIYALGSPFVFWVGATSIMVSIYHALVGKDKRIALVVFSYLAFFIPWAASPRVMFLYHYLPAVPFMAIATAYVLRKNMRLVPLVFAVFVISFAYFYPHWAGLNIPLWLDKSYYWFDGWR